MTETDWLACTTNPARMLHFLNGKTRDRKFRLFAVACCRSILRRLPAHTVEVEEVIGVAEKFAEGVTAGVDLLAIWRRTLLWDDEDRSASQACLPEARWAAEESAIAATRIALEYWVRSHPERRSREARAVKRAENVTQVAVLRCIFGNPFRPVTVSPAWLRWNDATVPKIAQSIYDDRRFEDLPILADALEDAGCDNEDILAHCRSEGPHVRGCWVVDLLLGKS